VTNTTITNGIYFYVFPCVGRFDMYLNKGAPAANGTSVGSLIWTNGADSTFKYLSIMTAPLDTVFYMLIQGYDTVNNMTTENYGSMRLVVTQNVNYPSQSLPPGSTSQLQGTVFNSSQSLKIDFTPAPTVVGFADTYTVYSAVGGFGNSVKQPFNGCSLPTLMNLVTPSPDISADSSMSGMMTYTLNNTHRKQADPAFSTAVRLCRQPSDPNAYQWCIAYEPFSVCDGTTCQGTRAAAPRQTALHPLAVAASALLLSLHVIAQIIH